MAQNAFSIDFKDIIAYSKKPQLAKTLVISASSAGLEAGNTAEISINEVKCDVAANECGNHRGL